MSVVNAVANVAAQALQPETEALRQKLRTYCFIYLVCGIVGFAGAFATYWMGFILAISFFIAFGITINHTKSPVEVYSNDCCLSRQAAFSNLKALHLLNAVGSGIGIIFCIIGIVVHAKEKSPIFYIVLAAIAMIACIVALPTNFFASQCCEKIHQAILPMVDKNAMVAVVATGAVVGASGAAAAATYPQAQPVGYNPNATVQTYPAAVPVTVQPVQSGGDYDQNAAYSNYQGHAVRQSENSGSYVAAHRHH